ncbi:hypothetical protein HMSSN036_75130 [Paenibacillus macerans]|nr:hypothetical protein HMSSN036_75130 [Paenibacillus macerans]
MYTTSPISARFRTENMGDGGDSSRHRSRERGGGRHGVRAGGQIFDRAIEMRSNIELHVSPGAVLSFSTDPEHYPAVVSRWEGVLQQVHMSCIFGQDLENVALTGYGTLDGNGGPWWDKKRNAPEELEFPRPKLISFDGCRRVTLRDLNLINSPSWTVNPIRCSDVTIDNLSIHNPADSPNTDGINPESCRNVRITGCHIDVGTTASRLRPAPRIRRNASHAKILQL